METWKNIYMDRRTPPPPVGKWKITRLESLERLGENANFCTILAK